MIVEPLRPGMSGKGSNLYHGVKVARHDILIFSDSDVELPPGAVARLVQPLLDPRVGVVAAAPFHTGSGLWGRLMAVALNVTIFAHWVPWVNRFRPPPAVPGGTVALRRDVLAKVGGVEAIAGYLAEDVRRA